MIEVSHLTKRFGTLTAVDDLTFTVSPGRVTGFLGPNGAGKTPPLRVAHGLIRATAGAVTFGGEPYARMRKPMRTVGAALEASSFHPGRTARGHLRMLAPLAGVPDRRCDEVLELVGLADAADKRVKGFSLGMRGRLGLAATLLADPKVLLLDEPANGLDPEGIAWLRGFLRHLAAQGRTVLISSHVLSEVQQTVDDVVIIAQGKLVHSSSLAELEKLAVARTLVVPANPKALLAVAMARQWRLEQAPVSPTAAIITGPSAAEIGYACFAGGVELHQLATQREGLEGLFLQLTEGQGAMR
jgi:ABC-2 type transport system ATP-binding protein